MNESFKPKTPERPLTAKETYEMKPPSRPFDFSEVEGWSGTESYLQFPPVSLQITDDVLNNQSFATPEERKKFALPTTTSGEEFEVSCCRRARGDTNRVDKMIESLDQKNPWEPGKIEHLLLMRHLHPSLLASHTIAIGTKKQRGEIPCLDKTGEQIRLATHNVTFGFNETYCFLIVRKKS
jgi:hypothetical protein